MKKYLKFLVFISILSCNKDYNDFNNNLLNYLSENNLNISIENSSNNCNLLIFYKDSNLNGNFDEDIDQKIYEFYNCDEIYTIKYFFENAQDFNCPEGNGGLIIHTYLDINFNNTYDEGDALINSQIFCF
ncbi:MAG: hypothetical protein HWD84_10650 [Flavobacteriaceae bacterium]|nr:hypothetical protein [Flavobacteriaceae bacterium]NVJ72746.1 hypothetical protein [Flavobacteriaceae bacterium]